MVSLFACALSTGTKLDAKVHEGRHVAQVTREPIKLGDYQPGLVLAAGLDGTRWFGAVRPVPAPLNKRHLYD